MNLKVSVVLFAVIAFVGGSGATADDPVFSGPQPGEKLVSFEVVSVYGQQAGREIDLIKMAGGKPMLLVFVHQLTRPGVALTRSLTGYAKSNEPNDAFAAIIWLDDDQAKAEEYLVRAKKSLNFPVAVGVSIDGGEGPGAYGLNRNVELTILIADKNQVVANFALVQPSVSEAATIASRLAKLIDQPPPSTKQMEAFAYPGGAMMARRKAAPGGGELRELMKAVIAADVTEATLRKAVTAIDDWVGDDRRRQQQLGNMAAAVLQRNMGSKTAQAQIKKWHEQYSDQEE